MRRECEVREKDIKRSVDRVEQEERDEMRSNERSREEVEIECE